MRDLGLEAMQAHNHALALEASQLLSRHWDTEVAAPPSLIGTMATVAMPASLGGSREDGGRLRDTLLLEDIHRGAYRRSQQPPVGAHFRPSLQRDRRIRTARGRCCGTELTGPLTVVAICSQWVDYGPRIKHALTIYLIFRLDATALSAPKGAGPAGPSRRTGPGSDSETGTGTGSPIRCDSHVTPTTRSGCSCIWACGAASRRRSTRSPNAMRSRRTT